MSDPHDDDAASAFIWGAHRVNASLFALAALTALALGLRALG